MSTLRRCDKRCHNARCEKCTCWCGGLFHGEKGARAREAFKEAFGDDVPAVPPEQGDMFGDASKFDAAFAAARGAA